MAHPKRKISTQRSKKRRTHHKIDTMHLQICPITQVHHLPHRAYLHEDKLYYRGRVVLEKSVDKKTK